MTPEEVKRLGLEAVKVSDLGFRDARSGHHDATLYRVADPAALVEALAERDALRADNQRLREALQAILGGAESSGYSMAAKRSALVNAESVARAALSATQETPDA